MATKIDTFKWVAATGRTRTLKAWKLSNSKAYKGLLHDTSDSKIREIDFYDYWEFIDWLSGLEYKFVSRQEITSPQINTPQLIQMMRKVLSDDC